MVVTLGEVLQRTAMGSFSTVHVKGQVEGEIEPNFYEEFRGELGRIWCLIDSEGFQLRVVFNDDDGVPRIRDGWMILREHYKFVNHHSIFFKYLGINFFQIIPAKEPITPVNFPTWHTQTRSLRKAVAFKLTMEDDPEVVPELTLPDKMGKYLWKAMLDEVIIVGANFERHKCILKYEKDPFVVKIETGWRECVGIFGFQVGDRLHFNMSSLYENHMIYVRKLN